MQRAVVIWRNPPLFTNMPGEHSFFNRFKSRTAAACACFVLAGVAVGAYTAYSHFDRFEAAKHQWAWYRVRGYKNLKTPPDVVLLGSSVLERIVNEAETIYLNRPIALFEHNRSCLFEDKFKSVTGSAPTIYPFAIGGLHASDASVLFSGVIANNPPRTLIYMIAPRDLLDNALPSIDATETFHLMKLTSKDIDNDPLVHRGTQQLFDHSVESTLRAANPLIDARDALSSSMLRLWRDQCLALQGKHIPLDKDSVQANDVGITEMPLDLPAQSYMTPQQVRERIHPDNFEAYVDTYQPFYPKTYQTQLQFLKRLLSAARQTNTKVVLVDMPLRSDNLKAMVPGFYKLYQSDLKKSATECGAEYLNMNDGTMADSDFVDTVHLNANGGAKFVDRLVVRMSKSDICQLGKRSGTPSAGVPL